MKPTVIVLTCEHASNHVPQRYQTLFKDDQAVLDSHLGWDIGALEIAKYLSTTLSCELYKGNITRLLIDFNRSLNHATCFSKYTRNLPDEEKQYLIDHYYVPYRQKIERAIHQHIEQGKQVLHVSLHSFTPEFQGNIRNAAIGLLYDPKRHAEKEVSRILQNLLIHHPPAYRVKMNYPYRGNTDGFTTTLRKHYTQAEYLGIEIETNQALVHNHHTAQNLLIALADSFQSLIQLL